MFSNGAPQTLTVKYLPTVEGVHQGALGLVMGGERLDVPLSGEGALPHLHLTPNPGALDFQEVLAGDARTMQVRLENQGGWDLTITPPVLTLGSSADYSASIAPDAVVVPHGQSAIISVVYQPSGPGFYTG